MGYLRRPFVPVLLCLCALAGCGKQSAEPGKAAETPAKGTPTPAKAVNVTTITLDEAPKGYKDFDKGAAKKFVIDPHGLIAA